MTACKFVSQELKWLRFFFPECAPDLSSPSSAASYAAEEVIEAKDAFVRYFSDEEGMPMHL